MKNAKKVASRQNSFSNLPSKSGKNGKKIEKLSNLWLENKPQSNPKPQKENLNVPLLKKPSLEISSFNPFDVNPEKDTERTADVKNRLKERLERINIQLQLRNSLSIQQPRQGNPEDSSLQMVKLNKISKRDTSQIQKMESSAQAYHHQGGNGGNKEFTFKANQLEGVLSKSRLNLQD